MKKVAVISDATSVDFFFPLWKRYYGDIFGLRNLHIVTYQGQAELFSDLGLGNVWEVNAIYDDRLRAKLISDFVTILLHTYDVVVRCDIDEILVPDFRAFARLDDFIQKETFPYTTAKGIDVVQLAGDPDLDIDAPIFGTQRRFGVRTTSLNKTCITSIPLVWQGGFHGANVFPRLSSLYNFHLKFADIKRRIKWHELMLSSVAPDTNEAKYFMDGAQRLINHQNWVSKFPKPTDDLPVEDTDFDRDFLEAIEFNSKHQNYQAVFKTEKLLVRLPFFTPQPMAAFPMPGVAAVERRPDAPRIALDIKPMGNLGNRMIQYLAARKLQSMLPNIDILRSNLPEFKYLEHSQDSNTDPGYLIESDSGVPIDVVISEARLGRISKITIHDHMQRMEWLPGARESAGIFQGMEGGTSTGDDEILINIRAAELVLGVRHYPLVPIDFYARIIDLTGLKPVFMGQIGENDYSRALKDRFSGCKFVASKGPLEDFNTIRGAKNIVVSVSTFSWLAAWLSDAKQIFLPMLGFFNPVQHRDRHIDLLPLGDSRYRYFKFPICFGVPEGQAMKSYPELTRLCREVTPEQIVSIRQGVLPREVAAPPGGFDAIWYSHRYLDAALEISEGWFADPIDHYTKMGYRGYLAMPENFSELRPVKGYAPVDHALGKVASQSSISQWSIGKTVREDASRALKGIDQVPFAFHTALEENPWWEVDLQDGKAIEFIVITNRSETDVVSGRSTPISAFASGDGKTWQPIFITPDALIVGRNGKPLVYSLPGRIYARFIRLTVLRKTFLHLRQVQIFGPTT